MYGRLGRYGDIRISVVFMYLYTRGLHACSYKCSDDKYYRDLTVEECPIVFILPIDVTPNQCVTSCCVITLIY